MSVDFKDEVAVISTPVFKDFVNICLTEMKKTTDPNVSKFVASVKSVCYYKEIVINVCINFLVILL
jgi:hypothetical protein